jgi:hypothetical protein
MQAAPSPLDAAAAAGSGGGGGGGGAVSAPPAEGGAPALRLPTAAEIRAAEDAEDEGLVDSTALPPDVELKCVCLVRADLNMSKGKVRCARPQPRGAHASPHPLSLTTRRPLVNPPSSRSRHKRGTRF